MYYYWQPHSHILQAFIFTIITVIPFAMGSSKKAFF